MPGITLFSLLGLQYPVAHIGYSWPYRTDKVIIVILVLILSLELLQKSVGEP